ncbi:helix-turn-helix domain-containing protein [Alsobacter sp. R-9]
MPRSANTRDRPHARIYFDWLELPAYRALSLAAQALLTHMLANYRPNENGRLSWSVRRVADAIQVSKATASRALNELEANGWIAVTAVGRFGCKARGSRYRLTMYEDFDQSPPTRDYLHVSANPRTTRRRSRPSAETQRFAERDTTVRLRGH